MEKEILNIQGFILNEQSKSPKASGELSSILTEIAFASKIVSREVNKAGLVDILGLTGKINIQGEKVQKLDEYANDIFIKILKRGNHVAGIASEENDEIISFGKTSPEAKYIICIDPLDGSSNVDVNVSVGTIFSIYKKLPGKKITEKDFLQKGTNQICAGYILYGSSTMFVYTTGKGVHGFTLDPSIGEFILSHENIKIPQTGKDYSINEGYSYKWNESIYNYIEYLKKPSKHFKKGHKARYIGSLVSDFHRNLLHGGIYIYAADADNPQGKLRLIYEGNPMAMLVENAGGVATNGSQRVLDIKPTEIHQRIPLFIGSKKDIQVLNNFLKEK